MVFLALLYHPGDGSGRDQRLVATPIGQYLALDSPVPCLYGVSLTGIEPAPIWWRETWNILPLLR